MTKPIKPNKYPRWATKVVRDNIYNQLNILEPLEQKKDIGWVTGEAPPSQYLNWLASTTHNWIVYFDYCLNRPEEYKKSKLPRASENRGKIIFVSDVEGGVLSFSDGTNWKKIKTEGNI